MTTIILYLHSFLSLLHLPLHHYHCLDLFSCYCFHHFDKTIYLLTSRNLYFSTFLFYLIFLLLLFMYFYTIDFIILTRAYFFEDEDSLYLSFPFFLLFSSPSLLLLWIRFLLLFSSLSQVHTFLRSRSFYFSSLLSIFHLALPLHHYSTIDLFSYYHFHHFYKWIHFWRRRLFIFILSFLYFIFLSIISINLIYFLAIVSIILTSEYCVLRTRTLYLSSFLSLLSLALNHWYSLNFFPCYCFITLKRRYTFWERRLFISLLSIFLSSYYPSLLLSWFLFFYCFYNFDKTIHLLRTRTVYFFIYFSTSYFSSLLLQS